MSEPESFTAAQASDPQTPGQVLADIAALRPDLRPAVAANPAAYPGLLEWLGSLGEPAVNAALAARRPAGAAAVAPQPAPTTPIPAQGYAPSGTAPAAPYGQQPQPGGYGQQPPPSGYGYQGTPPAKKSYKALWIVLGVVGLLIVLGIVAFALIFNAARNAITEYGTYGSDSRFDALWDRCADEDWDACDELYDDSPIGSEYETFGDTCGNRQPANTGVYCTSTFGGGTSQGGSDTGSEPFTYGDDARLDALWDACSGGDWQACDDLYWDAEIGSEYESYGDTCGGRQAEDTNTYCVDSMG